MIDGGVFIGRNPASGLELTEQGLHDYMAKYGIGKAVVASYRSIYFDFKEGNEDVIRLGHRYPGKIIPAAVIQPGGFDYVGDRNYISYLRNAGVKVLGIYLTPSYYELNLGCGVTRKIVQMAAAEGLAVQFGLRNASDLSQVVDYYRDLPCPILIRWMTGRGYHSLAEMIRVGADYSRFYFDVGALTCSGGIRHLADRVGANRLYFASNIPESFELSARLLLETAGLESEQRSLIFSGTLEKIFKVSNTGPGQDSPAWEKHFDPILTLPKIDAHWHIDGWNLIEPQKGIEHFDEVFRSFNYEKVLVSSIRALNDDMAEGNQRVFELAAKDPRVYGYVVVNPMRVEESLAEIDRYAANPKCVGIKTIQDLYGIPLDHESYRPILEKAAQLRLPVLAHIPGMAEAAERFTRLTLVCAHSTYERVKHLIGAPNVFFDITTSHNDVHETKMEKFIAEAGQTKLLYGSDGQLVNPAWTLGKLASCRLETATLERILFQNAESVFPKITPMTKGRFPVLG